MREPAVWQVVPGRFMRKMCELTAENPDVDVFFGPEIAHTEAEQKTGPVEVKRADVMGFVKWDR